MMKLYIVGFIGLFLIGTTLQGSHASLIPDLLETVESLLGLGSECSQTPQALPFKGGILTDDGEYIQGIVRTFDHLSHRMLISYLNNDRNSLNEK